MSLKSYLKEVCFEYKIYLGSLFIIAIIAAFLSVFVNFQVKEIIDQITAKAPNTHYYLFLFVALKFLHHFMFFIVRLLDIKYKPKFATRVTKDIYKKTIAHSLHWFDSQMSGEIVNKINDFQDSLSQIISGIFRVLIICFMIIIGIIFLYKIHYLAALILIIFLAIYTPIIVFLLKKQMTLQENYTQANQETIGVINDSIANIFSIRVIGNVFNEFKIKLTPALLKRQNLDRKTRIFDAWWVDNSDTFMTVVMTATQIFVLANLFQSGQITAGSFAFVMMVTLSLHRDVDQLLDYIMFQLNPQIAKIRTSYSMINQEVISPKKQTTKLPKNIKGEVNFNNVSFYYDQKRTIIDGFNLKIKAGEKIGIVGHSGAGKTTLIKCLLRYFEIQSGEILIDGINASNVSQESLLEKIAVIPQDITLFHRSILENLKFANYEASEDEIIKATKQAKIHEDILQMEKGYNTIVGERGVKISGGQRQRIAIARAILKDAPILILDEATSSLDSKTEKQIQESLNLLIKNKSKTVIAIAHRLSTLKHMDRIIVLDKGHIVEEGKHGKLLQNKNSLYKKLWELQEI
jgi:ATP-binding cassette subfamily B protein